MSFERLDKNNKALYAKLATVAVPIALQSLIGSSLNLIDNLMVGSLGESELAAVGVSVQIFFIFWMVIYGFSSGCSTFMAQFWGAKDMVNIRKTIGFTLIVCWSVGIIFFLCALIIPSYVLRIFTDIPETIQLGVGYIRAGAPCFLMIATIIPFEVSLRATQQTHIPLIVSIVAFVTNTILNYIFIFGHFGAPELGVTGAALATSCSRVLQAIIILFVVFGKKNIVAGKIKCYFGWSKAFAGKIIKNSIPTTINETMWGLGTAMYVAAFARIGITEYASVQAGNTIQNLFQLAAFSIGDAILILVGQKLGEGKTSEAFGLAKKLLKIGVLLGIVFGLALIAVAKPVISLFNFTPEGTEYTYWILVVYGLTMWATLLNAMLVTGVLRCGGDTKFAMFCETGTVWFIAVPLAFLSALVWNLPIYIAILVIKSEELVKGIILLKRFISKKWVKNLVNDID